MPAPPFLIRPFDHQTYSIPELTALLHRAYKPLADQGMRYLASHQHDSTTQDRIETGECYVAVTTPPNHRIIGTIVLVPPGIGDPDCKYYARPGVAWFQQFAVDPDLYNLGVGSALLNTVESRAAELGASELALDTSEDAHQLIAMYTKRGYEFVAGANWTITNYRSVIMRKLIL